MFPELLGPVLALLADADPRIPAPPPSRTAGPVLPLVLREEDFGAPERLETLLPLASVGDEAILELEPDPEAALLGIDRYAC